MSISSGSLSQKSAGQKSDTGGETIAYCTSCRMDLGHTIMAMVGDRIVQVLCRTCKKSHTYRKPRGAVEPDSKPGRVSGESRAEKKIIEMEDEWKGAMSASKAVPRPYSPKQLFKASDKLIHPQFGDGVILKLVPPNKIEILFRAGMKVLVHGLP